MSKPLKVGISACFFHADPQRAVFKGKTLQYLEESAAHWVMSQGALGFLIPSPKPEDKVSIKDLVTEMDGLLLQGGSDVCPKTYGEEPMKPEWNGDRIRDVYEIALVKEFLAQGKPVFGICRGAQLINVAFGGTLYQDIGTQLKQARNHRDWNIYDQNFHQVAIEPGSDLARLYGGKTLHKVNTVHHQALKDIGKGLVVEARCPEDGVVEAVRLKTSPDQWVVGVQWHPEFHDPRDASLMDGKPLLNEFMERMKACRR